MGRKPPYLIGSILLVVWSIPLFLLVDKRAGLDDRRGGGAQHRPGPDLRAQSALFEPRYRYSGVSISYALGAVLGGGFAPLIATWPQNTTGTSLAVSGYLIVVGLISLGAVLTIREPESAD